MKNNKNGGNIRNQSVKMIFIIAPILLLIYFNYTLCFAYGLNFKKTYNMISQLFDFTALGSLPIYID